MWAPRRPLAGLVSRCARSGPAPSRTPLRDPPERTRSTGQGSWAGSWWWLLRGRYRGRTGEAERVRSTGGSGRGSWAWSLLRGRYRGRTGEAERAGSTGGGGRGSWAWSLLRGRYRGRTGEAEPAGSTGGGGRGSWAWSWWWLLRGRVAFAATGRLMATLAGVFVWDGQRIEEEELQRSAQEMKHMENISSLFQGDSQRLEPRVEQGEQPWEMIMDKKHFKLWRRPIEGTHLYQYRVFGSYTDVTPRQFFNVQLDTEYRKKWDSLVIKLDVIERDSATGSEVIHWVTHFPYPMYSRDYVYVRRYSVDRENNLMVLVSRAVEHPSVPEDPEYVRVRTYESQMVIRPHKTFDENGFDYLLTYSDNPQTVFPRYCLSWMVSSGMPDFLEKLHTAALKAKKLELEVRDYLSAKGLEGSEAKAEGSRSPAQLEYA